MYDASQAPYIAVATALCGLIVLVRWWTLSEFEARQSAPGSWWDVPNRIVGAVAITFFGASALLLGWPDSVAFRVVAATALVAGIAAVMTTAKLWRPRWLLPRRLQVFIRQRIAAEPPAVVQRQSFVERIRGLPASVLDEPTRDTHHVRVFHIGARPDATLPADQRVAHYYARCDQDNLPKRPRVTAEEAFADARAHSTDVEPDLHAIGPASRRERFILASARMTLRAARRLDHEDRA